MLDDSENNSLCFMNGTCKNQIDVCKDEMFTGDNCSVPCSDKYENCKRCDRENICKECINKDRYGDQCNITCGNCPDKLCEKSGKCLDNKTQCEDPTFTGEYCNEKCDEINNKTNCLECDRKNNCLKCKNESFFGINCTQECDNCPGNPGECDVSGDCKDPDTTCKNSIYTGNNCSVLCNETINGNCHECDRKGNCLDCFNKIYTGNNCSILCNETINENCHECDINGICLDCFNKTKFGIKCNDLCNETINENCHECDINGICLDCFNKTKFGVSIKQNLELNAMIFVVKK